MIKQESSGAGIDAGDDYVMFISSRVVSLVMSHVRVPSLYARGGGRVHIQWEALEISFSHSRRFEPFVCILAKAVAAFLYRSDGFI